MLPQIERYEIIEEIGHGGMATVYRGRDVRLDRWVAIKVMHPHLRGAREARARFAREARAVAKLQHPAILEIYDYSGLDSENAYIAAELLTGPTLKVFAESQQEIPPEIVACIGVELACALAAAHAQGIVHRDVKPENVLLHEDRAIKLTDFGIAGMLDPSASAMTATGQILGSPAHMSPEQITDGVADPRSDVFALGTILYWLAVGRLPFEGNNPHQILKRVVDHDPRPPEQLRPALGRELSAILLRCLAKRPEERFEKAELLADALGAWLSELGIDSPRDTLAEYLTDPPGMAALLRERSMRALLDRATEQVRQQARGPATEALNRVLAMDEQNAEALALLGRLDRAALQRRLRRWALWGAGAVALSVALATAWPDRVSPEARREPQVHEDAPSAAATAETSPPISLPPSGSDVQPGPAQEPPAAGSDVGIAPSPEPARRPPRAKAPAPRPSGPRVVRFRPYPVNVSIAVDGAPPRPLGPDFQSVELPAGKHEFRFVGARECCVDKVLQVDVPAGPGTTVLEPRLDFRPARLYVVTDVPADVVVGDGLAKGRSRSVITVPVERSLIEPHRISVTAPGHEPYTGNVSLRAGKVKQVRVDLKSSAISP